MAVDLLREKKMLPCGGIRTHYVAHANVGANVCAHVGARVCVCE